MIPNIEDSRFIRPDNRLHYTDDLGFVIDRSQEIPDEFLRQQADLRQATASRHQRLPDNVKVASIPAVVVEKWLREGFNVYQEPAKAIVKRLREEGLTAFLATERQMF